MTYVFQITNKQIKNKQYAIGRKGSVQATPFKTFCARIRKIYNGKLDLRKHEYLENTFDGNTVVKRARNKLGHGSYNAITKNCETFAVWCKTGKAQSIQSLTNFEFVLDVSVKAAVVIIVVAIIAGLYYHHGIITGSWKAITHSGKVIKTCGGGGVVTSAAGGTAGIGHNIVANDNGRFMN